MSWSDTQQKIDETKLLPENLLFSLLRVDGTGSVEMNVDGSVTAVSFRFVVPTAKRVFISRVLFDIVDSGIRPNRFGGVGNLTNGLTVKFHDADDSLLIDPLDGVKIKQNADFTIIAAIDAPIIDAVGDDHLPVRWTIARTGHAMDLTAGQYLEVIISDNLSPITQFRTMVQGEVFDA